MLPVTHSVTFFSVVGADAVRAALRSRRRARRSPGRKRERAWSGRGLVVSAANRPCELRLLSHGPETPRGYRLREAPGFFGLTPA